MAYRATNESSTQTPEERHVEAGRILVEMGLLRETDRMTAKEAEFCERMSDALEVSPKQLWWLRDLKEKYL